MRKILREALTVTNNTIILAIPLILFVKLIDLYSLYSKNHVDTTLKLVIASVTLICMFCIFGASWFHMVKEAVKLSKKVFVLDSDRAKAGIMLLKTLLDGVGKYFLSFLGAACFYIFVIQILATQIVWFLGSHLIGSLDSESIKAIQEISLSAAASNTSSMSLMLDRMTPDMIVFFGKWSLLFAIVTCIVMYLLMLWFPEIIYKERNPIIAFGTSIIKLFKDFKNTVKLYLFLWFIGFLILFFNTFSIVLNPFVYLIVSIIMFYFCVYVAVCIFLYYDNKYVTEDNEED